MSGKKHNQENSLQVKGKVNIKKGDVVLGNKNISVERKGVYIGGNVNGSNIIMGNNNKVGVEATAQETFFAEVIKKIEQRSDTSPDDKDDLKVNIGEFKAEAERGNKADESFLARRIRNIERIAPDIADVVLATVTSPAAGFAAVVRKVAERAKKVSKKS